MLFPERFQCRTKEHNVQRAVWLIRRAERTELLFGSFTFTCKPIPIVNVIESKNNQLMIIIKSS